MSLFPEMERGSHEQLVREGYVFRGWGRCGRRGCKAPLVWYRTPNGKAMPFDVASYKPHEATCRARKRIARMRTWLKHLPMLDALLASGGDA